MRGCLLPAVVGLLLIAGSGQARELKNVGVSVGSMGNPYYVALAKGAEDAARAINPNVHVTAVGFERDIGKQVDQINSFIAAGTDMIVMSPADPEAVAPAVARAEAAGIKVLAVDTAVDNADIIVTTDNVKAGTIACQYIADHLQNKGNVIILNGPQNSAVRDRITGCKQVFASHSEIKILSDDQDGKSSRDGGLAVMQTLLTRFPKVDGVFTCCDPEAIGADLAAKQLNRSGFMITSVDGSPEIVAALKDDTLVKASASQDPYGMAVKAVKMGYDLMNGKPVEPKKVLVDPVLVTRDNVKDYKGWTSH